MIKTDKAPKIFEDHRHLREVACEIPDGVVYGLVGSNGAGKSTLLRLLAGVYKTNGGCITYDGQPVYDNYAVKKGYCVYIR